MENAAQCGNFRPVQNGPNKITSTVRVRIDIASFSCTSNAVLTNSMQFQALLVKLINNCLLQICFQQIALQVPENIAVCISTLNFTKP